MPNTVGGHRLPIPVKCVHLLTNETQTFTSIQEAAKFLIASGQKSTNHRPRIANSKDKAVPYAGYMWYTVEHVVTTTNAETDDVTDIIAGIEEHADEEIANIIVGPANVYSVLLNAANGLQKRVRFTNEKPPRVSVFDLVGALTGSVNPHRTFKELANKHQEVLPKVSNFLFEGQGQKPTPVTNAEGAVLIITHLPGDIADNIKKDSITTVMNAIGGDMRMVDTIVRNAKLAQVAPANHPIHFFNTRGEGEPIPAAVARVNHLLPDCRYSFKSPSMVNRYLDEFKQKRVVYLVVFEHEGQVCLKFGKSEECLGRMDNHIDTFDQANLWCMFEANYLKRIEDAFKEKMRYRDKLIGIKLNGLTLKEIVTGIDPSEAEDVLRKCVDSIDQGDYTRIRLEEIGLEKTKLEFKMKEKDLEWKKQELEAKMKIVALMGEQLGDLSLVKELLGAVFTSLPLLS